MVWNLKLCFQELVTTKKKMYKNINQNKKPRKSLI